MMTGESDKLLGLLQPVVEGLGYELLGLQLLNQGSGRLLRVYIDAPQGIGLQDCQQVSSQLSALLDVEEPLSGNYSLEVSSPGADRPLFKLEHYQCFIGQRVKIRLRMALQGRKRFAGNLVSADKDEVVVEIDEGPAYLPFEQIESARLDPFNS